eukprot:6183957-Pleurochrysis_carterae.AAC.1
MPENVHLRATTSSQRMDSSSNRPHFCSVRQAGPIRQAAALHWHARGNLVEAFFVRLGDGPPALPPLGDEARRKAARNQRKDKSERAEAGQAQRRLATRGRQRMLHGRRAGSRSRQRLGGGRRLGRLRLRLRVVRWLPRWRHVTAWLCATRLNVVGRERLASVYDEAAP